MKIKYDTWCYILMATGLLMISVGTLGAIMNPRAIVPGICIYEVSMSALINTINIGWTLSPCRDLDIREIEDYTQLTHSSFQPVCLVYSVQAWPGIYLPVVDYRAESCRADQLPLQRQAAGGVFHAITTRD